MGLGYDELMINPTFTPDSLREEGKEDRPGCDIVDRWTKNLVATVYPDPNHDALAIGAAFAAVPQLVAAAQEALAQIRYLHEKFQPTGTGETVMTRLQVALARVERPDLHFAHDSDEKAHAEYEANKA